MDTSPGGNENPDRHFEIDLIEAVFQRVCLCIKTNLHYGCRMRNNSSWLKVSRIVKRPIAECKDKWYFLFQTFLHFSRLETAIGYDLLCVQWPHYKFFKKMQSQMATSYTDLLTSKATTKPYSPRESAELDRLIHQIEARKNELMTPTTSCRRRQEIWTDIVNFLNERFPTPQRCVIEWQMIWWDFKQECLISLKSKGQEKSREEIRFLKIFGIDSVEDPNAISKLSMNYEFNEDVNASYCLNCPVGKTDLKDGLCNECYEPCSIMCEICLKAKTFATLSTKAWGMRANKLISKAFRNKEKVRFCLRCHTTLRQKASWLWKICRVCGESKHPLENLMHASYDHLRETFHTATGFRFRLSDGLPCFACIKCRDELMDFIRVYLTFSNTQKVLLEIQKKCLVGDGPIQKTEKSLSKQHGETSRKQSKRLKLQAEKTSFRATNISPFEEKNYKSGNEDESVYDETSMSYTDEDIINASEIPSQATSAPETLQLKKLPQIRVYSRKRKASPVQNIKQEQISASDTDMSSTEQKLEQRPLNIDGYLAEVNENGDSSNDRHSKSPYAKNTSKGSSVMSKSETAQKKDSAATKLSPSSVTTRSQRKLAQPNIICKRLHSDSPSAEKLLSDLEEISLTPIDREQSSEAIRTRGKLKPSNVQILYPIRRFQRRASKEKNTLALATTLPKETDTTIQSVKPCKGSESVSVTSKDLKIDIISVLNSLNKSSELSITGTRPAKPRRVTRSMEQAAISLTVFEDKAKYLCSESSEEATGEHRVSLSLTPVTCSEISAKPIKVENEDMNDLIENAMEQAPISLTALEDKAKFLTSESSEETTEERRISQNKIISLTPVKSLEISAKPIKVENEDTSDLVENAISSNKSSQINPRTAFCELDGSFSTENPTTFNPMPGICLPDMEESTKEKALELYRTLFLDDEDDDVEDDENVGSLNKEHSFLQIKNVFSLNESCEIKQEKLSPQTD